MQDLQVDGGQEVSHRDIISNIRTAQDHPGSQTPAIKAAVREAWSRGPGRQGGLFLRRSRRRGVSGDCHQAAALRGDQGETTEKRDPAQFSLFQEPFKILPDCIQGSLQILSGHARGLHGKIAGQAGDRRQGLQVVSRSA